MADWEYPLQALATAVEARLSAVGGAPARHYVGKKHIAANHAPPRYVWVPDKGRESDKYKTPAASEVAMTAALEDHFLIGCWGRSPKEAWAMANNVYRAVRLELGADQRPMRQYNWERASEAWNQNGELVVLQFEWGVPFIDAYVALDPAATEPEAATVMPTAIEADIQKTEAPELGPGETAVTVSTTPGA